MFKEIIELIDDNKYVAARCQIIEMNVVDIELLLEELSKDKMLKIFRMLPKEIAADVFAYLDADQQQFVVESITDYEINNIMNELFMDDTVDFIEEMPANVVKRVLKNTDEATRKTINQLLRYPDDSAGSLMTTEFVDLKKEMTVEMALTHIRKTGIDKETINTCYVMDSARHLEGTISVRKLILSNENELLSDIMNENIISIRTLDDQEQIAEAFKKYDLLSIPVVDNENRLVGIITVDDIVDVIEQETTEDFHKMAAIIPSENEYLKTNVFTMARNRVLWLFVLMISATFTSMIIRSYEVALSANVALSRYFPMLMGTAGNAGAQSSTMIIRSLSLHQVEFRDLFRVMLKEMLVGIMVALVLSIANFARIMIFDSVGIGVTLCVCITLFAIVSIAKIVGGMLPIIAAKLKMDPVIMASPLITTILDILSLIIYFKAATVILGI